MESPSKHLGIKNIQTIFKENEHRLYHRAKDRDVPADNNKSEREIRPSVIARKVNFGSQSAAGAKARSTIMTFLETVNKRLD
ncbi:MAG TPA: transposase [bacterium]|nr:transposase [bacterium]